jgi:tetratricopeptide (TPR) repeat protein
MSVHVCSICSRVGITSGQWHHMAHHVSAAGHLEFICGCVPRENASAVLERQQHRFCYLCRERTGNTEADRFENRFWCCADCRQRIEHDGLPAAIAESRKWDLPAATTFLKEARGEVTFHLYENAVLWYDRAIPTFEHLVNLGCDEWAETLARAKSERESAQRELDEDNRDPERVRRRDVARSMLVLAHARLGGGLIRAKNGDTQGALALFQELVVVCKKDGDGSAEWVELHARALGNIGGILSDLVRWTEAVEAFQESLRLFETLYESDDKYAEDLAMARDSVTEAVVRLSLSQGEAPMEKLP